MHRAEPQSRRMPGLGEVLRVLEDREMWEAEQFALRSMDEQDEQTRRASSGQPERLKLRLREIRSRKGTRVRSSGACDPGWGAALDLV